MNSEILRHRDLILQLRNEGFSQLFISQQIGHSQTSVGIFLRQMGKHGRSYAFLKELSKSQQNILVGSLLGDGSIGLLKAGKQPYLSFSHGSKQRDYLIWKATQFGPLFTHTDPGPGSVDKNNHLSFHISSRTHPFLKTYYDLFYSRPDSECTEHIHKKQITSAILDILVTSGEPNWEAMAIWFCDDGTRGNTKQPSICLCMGGLSEMEYIVVESLFQEWGFHPSRHDWLGEGKNRVKLGFGVSDSSILIQKMAAFIPECMRWKFNPRERQP